MKERVLGVRKLIGFVITIAAILYLFTLGLMMGVQITGENLSSMAWMVSFLSGAYFGANMGEHWAKTRTPKGPAA